MTYAEINGLSLYFDEHGSGEPLILLHGGLGSGGMFGPVLAELAKDRRVITVDLQGHGRTADVDRPIRAELMADDIAGLIRHLGLARADVMGYSLGGTTALRTAIQHPDVVGRLVLVSIPFKRDGWFPESRADMDQMGSHMAEPMMQAPIYELYSRIAPRPEDWPALIGKMGDYLRHDYDWSAEAAGLGMPVMLVFADADAVMPAHIIECFEVLGGGLRDARWDGAFRPKARLAILPGRTHYDLFDSPALAAAVIPFLNGE
jgi:pimeloyl-ACP methyl ester carboxylesterase